MIDRTELTRVTCVCVLASILASIILPTASTERPIELSTRREWHSNTNWRVTPSLKFDTLCVLNALSGDPFYLKYYQKEYDELAPRLPRRLFVALDQLKQKVKDQNKNIISAFLSFYFSATDDQSIDDMLKTLDDTSAMKRELKQSVYFNDAGWKLFESVRADLKTILTGLKEIGFAEYWTSKVLPRIQEKRLMLEAQLSSYNVIPQIERCLGFPLGSNTITIYLLGFAQPHGIRITGVRFIADVSYPLRVVLQNSIHEMMHPPYELSRDQELRKALAHLKADDFLMDKILHHNPAFGYNSFESFVEEDFVRALEQVVSERLDIATPAKKRWKDEDDGIHVLAVATYSLMKHENFGQTQEGFRDFVIRMIKSGRLTGKIENLYKAFYRNE